ncbi:MAG: serine protein kinase PrkA [Polyangiaceae bacterium]|nr:serine protein kinase PrkA [Polyangiaceae bacterium]
MASSVLEELRKIATDIRASFQEEKRRLSFQEYLELFETDPVRHSRDASRYVRDMFTFYGTEEVQHPFGVATRFKLFDLPFSDPEVARREALVGQEALQQEIFRSLNNFGREGRPNRMILLHGPNGSAKTTAVACLMRALENYSTLDEGALYRFHWIFPNYMKLKGSIGFTRGRGNANDASSYAHLDEEEVDARLFIEVRDHPLFLIPEPKRARWLEDLYARTGAKEPPPAWIVRGSLSHKSKQVFDALLGSYDGDLNEVLRHVQVERYFISRRYRIGAVTIGPQLSVDAGERQVTADRSVGALPTSLQSLSLFEAYGELLDCAGGIVEFSDLLKRPLDAFKYLQQTVETGTISLRSQDVALNCVMVGSANELHLAAFREHPEYESFRGRMELIRAPYLRSWVQEKHIYDSQIAPQVRRHVAPHATEIGAMFAVLTRMRRPKAERYEGALAQLISELTAVEKMDLYSLGHPPERFSEDARKLLRANIHKLYHESDAYPVFEGGSGASPREMRTVLLDAAQSPLHECLSPFAVLRELDELCSRPNDYPFLQEERLPGGYHDHALFRSLLRQRLLDELEAEMCAASGLVDEARYAELFERYISHVSFWIKGEKIQNPVTGQHENPDENLMSEVEALIGGADRPEQVRHTLINLIGAWAVDHQGEPVSSSAIFREYTKRLKDAVFTQRRTPIAKICRDMVVLLRDNGSGLDSAQKKTASEAIERMKSRFGYEEASAVDACAALLSERFADVFH